MPEGLLSITAVSPATGARLSKPSWVWTVTAAEQVPASTGEEIVEIESTLAVSGSPVALKFIRVGLPPAVMLAGLVRRMEKELGLSGSIGLSHNKFLAKIAADLA